MKHFISYPSTPLYYVYSGYPIIHQCLVGHTQGKDVWGLTPNVNVVPSDGLIIPIEAHQ